MDQSVLLAQAFVEEHPHQAARVLEQLPIEDSAAFLEECRIETAALALASMLAERGARCLRQLSSGRAGALVSRIEPEKAARLLRRLEPEEIPPLLAQADEKRRSALERLLRYPEGAAGSFMDPLVLALPPNLKVSQALKQLSSDPAHVRYYVYVVDPEEKLIAVLSLRELMAGRPQETVEDLMRREAVLAHPAWRRFHSLPVVDRKARGTGGAPDRAPVVQPPG